MAPPSSFTKMLRAEHVRAVPDHRAVIVDRAAGGEVLRRERHAEIEVEVAAVRGDPGECPAHPVLDLLDPLERHARDRGERQVGMLEMLPRRVDMIGDERAAAAHMVRARRQHEMIDGELAAAAEQVAERAFALGPFEDIGLLDPDPGQLPALGAERVELRGSWRAPWREAPCGRQATLRAKRSHGSWSVSFGYRLGVRPRAAGSELQPGRQVEEAHQQVHPGHAVDRQACPKPRSRSRSGAHRSPRSTPSARRSARRRGRASRPRRAPATPIRCLCLSLQDVVIFRLPIDCRRFRPLQDRATM